MKTLQHIAFVLDDFGLGSPGQQLLDRFLLGYPREGAFHHLEGCEIRLYCPSPKQSSGIEPRVKEHGLVFEPNLADAIAGTDGIVLATHRQEPRLNEQLVSSVLAQAGLGTPCFVHGLLGTKRNSAAQQIDLARARHLPLLAGTALMVTWHLPELHFPTGTPLKEALVVVQGAAPGAELEALDALLPVLERRGGGEPGVRAVRALPGPELWKHGEAGLWPRDLLAAAISRSDSPQGDALKDGRTQDLVGLGLVPKLAREPRGWLLEHFDGLRTTILVLDGVVGDYNYAIRTGQGAILSAQIYRAPKPAQHEFSRLVGVVEDFFRNQEPPWSTGRALLTADILERMEV